MTEETASKAKRWGGAGGGCTQSSPDGEATSTGCRCTTEEKATKQFKDTFEKGIVLLFNFHNLRFKYNPKTYRSPDNVQSAQ